MGAPLLTPANAWGHAAFVESEPEAGTRLESGPGEITLEFTEPLNRALSKATLVNASSGEEVTAAVSTGEEEKQLVVRPQERLGRAAYEVDWQTVSTVDGHTLEGSFSFGVRTAAVETEHAVEQSPLARDGWLRIGTRALLYVALFFFAGGVLNAALLARRSRPGSWLVPAALDPVLERAGRDPDATRDEVWLRTLDVGWLALAGAIAVALAETADAAGGLSAQALSDFLLSNGAGLARVGTVIAIAAGFPLGMAVGRIGDVINGEHYGPASELPWAFRYTHPYAEVPSNEIAYHSGGFYEVVLALAMLALIWPLRHRFRRPGTLLWAVIALYSAGRFFMFFVRSDSETEALGLSGAQWTSLALLAAAAVAAWLGARPATPGHGEISRARAS